MKIAVCVPVHRNVPATFFKCFADMLSHSALRMQELHLLIEENGSLEMKRNRLALSARASGADFVLWLDDDQTFPPDALERLLKHDLSIVGCNIVTRSDNPLPTALGNGKDERIYTTRELANACVVQEVRSLGLGFCLMKMSVLDTLDQWAKSKGAQMAWPLFDSRTDHLGNVTTGEDVFFFGLVEAAGVPVFLDHALSWEVGHLAQTVRLNAHAKREDDDESSVLPATGN